MSVAEPESMDCLVGDKYAKEVPFRSSHACTPSIPYERIAASRKIDENPSSFGIPAKDDHHNQLDPTDDPCGTSKLSREGWLRLTRWDGGPHTLFPHNSSPTSIPFNHRYKSNLPGHLHLVATRVYPTPMEVKHQASIFRVTSQSIVLHVAMPIGEEKVTQASKATKHPKGSSS